MLVTAGDIITFSSSSWAVVEFSVSCKTENVMSPKRNTCLQSISRLNKLLNLLHHIVQSTYSLIYVFLINQPRRHHFSSVQLNTQPDVKALTSDSFTFLQRILVQNKFKWFQNVGDGTVRDISLLVNDYLKYRL